MLNFNVIFNSIRLIMFSSIYYSSLSIYQRSILKGKRKREVKRVKSGRKRPSLSSLACEQQTLFFGGREATTGNASGLCRLAFISSGRFRPSDKAGPGHPDPEIRGGGRRGGLRILFSALRASVWSKQKKKGGTGSPPPPPPLDPLLISLLGSVRFSWPHQALSCLARPKKYYSDRQIDR